MGKNRIWKKLDQINDMSVSTKASLDEVKVRLTTAENDIRELLPKSTFYKTLYPAVTLILGIIAYLHRSMIM